MAIRNIVNISESYGDFITSIVIWQVPKNKNFPEGYKYRLALIYKGKRIFGFDHNTTEKHHKHYFDKKSKYHFKNLDKLMVDFKKEENKIWQRVKK